MTSISIIGIAALLVLAGGTTLPLLLVLGLGAVALFGVASSQTVAP